MPELVLYNTLGRKLAPFQPIVPGEVSIYTCGPTVYNDVHIGNLRTFLFEDLLRRALRLPGLQGDAGDEPDGRRRQDHPGRAQGRGFRSPSTPSPSSSPSCATSTRCTWSGPEHFPRATEHIAEIIELIARLIERGYAYESEGSVFFSIARDA